MRRVLIVAFAVPVLLAGIAATAESRETGGQTTAGPGTLTICHKTGSASNGWRRITVSTRAWANPKSRSGRTLRAHLRHTGDAVVVGAAACPSPTVTPAPRNTPAARITICHKTGSSTSPFRRITVSSRALTNPNSTSGRILRGHMGHAGDMLLPGTNPCPPGTQNQPTRLSANLQPVQGASGSGTATFTIRMGLAQLCYTLTVTGLSNVEAAHIHRVAGEAIVVPLSPPTTGTSSECVTVEKALLQEIVRSPAAFFVNVHTLTHPNGQVRGTLTR
jgi:hypothetical protein